MYKDSKHWNEPLINGSNDIQHLNMWSSKEGSSMASRMLYYLELSYKVRTYIRKYQREFDVVYVTTPNIFLSWAPLFFQKKQKSTKRIVAVLDIEKINIDKFYPTLKFMEKMMYHKTVRIVINNEGFHAFSAKSTR